MVGQMVNSMLNHRMEGWRRWAQKLYAERYRFPAAKHSTQLRFTAVTGSQQIAVPNAEDVRYLIMIGWFRDPWNLYRMLHLARGVGQIRTYNCRWNTDWATEGVNHPICTIWVPNSWINGLKQPLVCQGIEQTVKLDCIVTVPWLFCWNRDR